MAFDFASLLDKMEYWINSNLNEVIKQDGLLKVDLKKIVKLKERSLLPIESSRGLNEGVVYLGLGSLVQVDSVHNHLVQVSMVE